MYVGVLREMRFEIFCFFSFAEKCKEIDLRVRCEGHLLGAVTLSRMAFTRMAFEGMTVSRKVT